MHFLTDYAFEKHFYEYHLSALVVFLFLSFLFYDSFNRYDPLSSCLVDFKGRANMASVKNCQFVVSEPGHEAATPGMLCVICYYTWYFAWQCCLVWCGLSVVFVDFTCAVTLL